MKYFFICLSIFVLINSKIINEENINITFLFSDVQYISDNDGYFSLKSYEQDSIDLFDNTDIETKTAFEMDISGKKTYHVKCKLWKGEEKYIYSICNLKGGLQANEMLATIYQNISIQYNDNNVNLEFAISFMTMYKVSSNVPFIYSDTQNFNIQENQDKINLQFKFESYNNEPLIIKNKNSSIVPLENCKTSGKILNCEILKEKLNIVSNTNNTYQLIYYHDIIGSYSFSSTGYIYINYVNIVKENIYLKLEKPVDNKISESNFIAFPTNITNLPKIRSEPMITRIIDENAFCFLIKHRESTPLYLVCSINKNGDFNIVNYDGFEGNNIHYKYNFILKPGSMDAPISLSNDNYVSVYFIYPEILDFSKKDSINIFLESEQQNWFTPLRLNQEGDDLECRYEWSTLMVCKVPKSHFNGAKNGYYYIRHKNEANEYKAHYESFGVGVELSGYNIKVSSTYTFLFGLLSLIVF